MASKIMLQCVKVAGKLRIRFHSFTNDEGKVFTNVYDQTYNTMFPKDIRVEGRYYEIGPHDLSLVNQPGKTPFYRVNKANIKVVSNVDLSTLRVFSVDECVICMSSIPNVILVPCGHQCCCSECYKAMAKLASCNSCPLCRRKIESTHIPISSGASEAGEATSSATGIEVE